jgi:hypothetical protein
MSELSLRSVHPAETKEIASLSARFITSFVIAFAGILSFAPFLAYFTR